MRLDDDLLRDILERCEAIERIAKTTDRERLVDDHIPLAALLHHFTIIGEAMNRLSDPLKLRHPQIAWRQPIAMRNRIVHQYFNLDVEVLWNAATISVPGLRPIVAAILAAEFPEQ